MPASGRSRRWGSIDHGSPAAPSAARSRRDGRTCVARDFRRSVGFGSRINVSGLGLERVLRATMDISARAISLPDRPRTGHLGHQCSHTPGRPVLHLVSSSRRPRQVTVVDATSSLAPCRCSSFVRAVRPFLHPGLRLKSGAARRGRQGWPSRLALREYWRFQATRVRRSNRRYRSARCT
jgi:hypothetical protein